MLYLTVVEFTYLFMYLSVYSHFVWKALSYQKPSSKVCSSQRTEIAQLVRQLWARGLSAQGSSLSHRGAATLSCTGNASNSRLKARLWTKKSLSRDWRSRYSGGGQGGGSPGFSTHTPCGTLPLWGTNPNRINLDSDLRWRHTPLAVSIY